MRHDASIPQDLHSGYSDQLKDALGAFWASVFSDRDLVKADIVSRVLAASQLYINAMEALSLRDHSNLPVFHREHWHPMVIRLSEQNTGYGLTVGMPDDPVIGEQPDGSVYLADSVFEVGGNAQYSKVNTYPYVAFADCPLVSVGTCICDSVTYPTNILMQDRDFAVSDGVIAIRKEQDPFSVSGYRIVDDGDDKLAVLWVCDGEFDTSNVNDFLAYPMGINVGSTHKAARMLSALWDTVVFGLTAQCLNALLGALFDVPVSSSDTTVESVVDDAVAGYKDIITTDAVYRVDGSHLRDGIAAGSVLHSGDFLTDEISVYYGLSKDDIAEMVYDKRLGRLSLPAGSVFGVSDNVVIENRDSGMESGGWFKLNEGDTADSPFWSVVLSRASQEELTALFTKMAGGGSTVNPLLAIGYTVLANTILVRASCRFCEDACTLLVWDALRHIVPAYSSMLVIQDTTADSEFDLAQVDDSSIDSTVVSQKSTISDDNKIAITDNLSYRFFPDGATEV